MPEENDEPATNEELDETGVADEAEESTQAEENGEVDEADAADSVPEGTEWIDAAFIAASTGVDEDDIQDVQVCNAVAEGNNYCSCMLRVRAHRISGETIKIVLKIPPRGDLMINYVSAFGFFKIEIKLLTVTLPALQELGAARCGEDSPLARPLGPQCLPCSRPDTLVMEDLGVLGFRNADRLLQLDMAHSKMTLTILARLHALSMAKYREDPTFGDEYSERILLHENPDSVIPIELLFRSFGKELDTWEEMEGTNYGERFRALAPSAKDRVIGCAARKEDSPYNVLNHGDLWVNNIMFRYEEGNEEPADVRLVDLQVARFSSQALDLQYFIYSSVREEVRLTGEDELLDWYRNEFNENVIQLGIGDAALSADELREEYDDKALFGLYVTIFFTCLMVAHPSERIKVEDMKPEDYENAATMTAAWRCKRFRALVPKLMEHFDNAGVI